jgi:hypothetical protein
VECAVRGPVCKDRAVSEQHGEGCLPALARGRARPDGTSLPAHVHADLRIEGNRFDTGPGPTFWLMDIHGVNITSNVITYCSKVVVYPSGGVLNASSNAGGGEFDLEDNELHAVDSPRLCAKTDDDGGAVPVVPVGTRGHTVPAVVPTVPYGTCAFTENVSCEKLAQIVGHLSSSYIHRLLLATAVHDCRYLRISSISLPWCHLKCAALI